MSVAEAKRLAMRAKRLRVAEARRRIDNRRLRKMYEAIIFEDADDDEEEWDAEGYDDPDELGMK